METNQRKQQKWLKAINVEASNANRMEPYTDQRRENVFSKNK